MNDEKITVNILEKYKNSYDILEYLKEIKENNDLLNNFDREKAINQEIKLTTKYNLELNTVALFSKNNMQVIYTEYSKVSDEKIKQDINYINSLIPGFAVEREGIKVLIKEGE